MSQDKKNNDKPKKPQKTKGQSRKITGLDIDRAEYQEIILSNSAFPDRSFGRRD